MRQNLHTGKIFLNISAKYRVPLCYMKMARIFQQCTNCFEKESSVTNVAGLVNSFGTDKKLTPNIFSSKIRHENEFLKMD
jgi:hypothetical protein